MKRLSEVIKQDQRDKILLKNLHKPHFRLTSLAIYLVFILIFNLIIVPTFGLNSKVNAATFIDASRLVDLANQDRAQNGNLPALVLDQRLVTAATNKAIDMFKKQYWAHYGPNGETPWQFIVGAGYNYTYAGENLAKDFSDTDSVNTAWMNSTTHRANILNTNYKNIGIAAVSGKQICSGTYPDFPDNTTSTCIDTVIVVQMFGSPAGSSSSPSTGGTVTKTSTPAKTVVPTTTVAPKAPSVPVIVKPENGSNIASNNVEIQGTTDKNTSLTIYEGDRKVGTIDNSDGSFDFKESTFEDGEHTISAVAKNNTNSLETKSSNVTFSVDTKKPVFNSSNITIQLNNSLSGEYFIEGIFGDDTVFVKTVSGENTYELNREGNTNIFSGIIKVDSSTKGIVLSSYDKAGNTHTEEISLPYTPMTSVVTLSSSGQNIVDSSNVNLNTKQTVNLIVGILVLFIFLIDSILVIRSGRHISENALALHKASILKNRGSFFHHVVPVAVVLMAILTTFTGKIT